MTRILHFANSSLFFYADRTGILIDGLFGAGPYQCFSPLPAPIRRQMLKRQGIFGHVDALLFTHAHGDHCDRDALHFFRHLHEQPPAVFLFGESDNTLHADRVDSRIQRLEVGAFTIYAMAAPHQCIGKKNKALFALPNCSFIVCQGTERFFVAADSRWREEDLRLVQPFGRFNAVFCNAYHLIWDESKRFFEKLDAERIYIYHLPLQEDDIYAYHSLAKHAAQNFRMRNQRQPAIMPQMEWLGEEKPLWAENLQKANQQKEEGET